MKVTIQHLILSLAASALAAPVDNEKRHLSSGSGSLPSIAGISPPSLSGVALPTGGLGGSSGGLGGLGSDSTGGLGGLESGSTGGLGGQGSGSTGGLESSSSGLEGLESSGDLSGLKSGSSMPSTTLKKRQSLGGFGGLTTGLPSGSGGLGSGGLSGLGGSSTGIPSLGSGSGGLGSLGGSSGGLSGLGSGTSGVPSLGSDSTGDLGSLGGLSSGSSSLTPSTTLKERQDLGSLSGFGSSSSALSGLGGLTGSSGSLGGLTGSTGTTSTSDSGSSAAASGGCKALTLIFARGTGEMGTMGTVIGPPLATALANALGADKVSSQGVDYPADAGGNANMGASGGPAMASQAKQVFSSCPNSKVVLSGYSQGAMVVHNALSSQGLDGSKVAAVVAFGDPLNGQAFEGVNKSKCKEFCGSSDFLCSSGGTTGSGSHLSYTSDADAAAKFIVQATGL